MDGVLVEAKDWHYEALNKALGLFGYTISRYDHLITYDGLPTKKKLEMLSRERGLPVKLHAFINDMKQIYTNELIHLRCHPLFHHEYALARLKSDGLKLAVCSNSIRATVTLIMEKTNLGPYMEFFVSNQDVTHAKPHPEIYERAIRRLKLKPSECIVVEDNPNGIQAATAAGAHVLQVRTTDDVTYQAIRGKIEAVLSMKRRKKV